MRRSLSSPWTIPIATARIPIRTARRDLHYETSTCRGRGNRGRACGHIELPHQVRAPWLRYTPGRRAWGYLDQRPDLEGWRLGRPGSAGPTTTSPPAPSSTSTATRTTTGAAVNYNYGVLSVAVTVSGTKLTNVTIASIDEGGNFRSQSIDQQAIPILEQEALQAQSANIQGVSGASYTSMGFDQSLQSALTQLGFR